MPIGGIIGGIAGSIFGGNKTDKAIEKASDAQAAATKEAIALQREIYNQNVGFQTPLYNNGMAASNQINALLGIGGTQPNYAQNANPANNQTLDQWAQGAVNAMLPNITKMQHRMAIQGAANPQAALEYALSVSPPSSDQYPLYQDYLSSHPKPTITTQPVGQPIPAQGANSAQSAAEAAYNIFKNSTGYQSRLTEANNSLNSAYAAKGTLQSGAALQAMAKMNQDYASNEFGNYLGQLGGQQQLAAGAANALAGVGTNYANSVGNLTMQNGNNIANAAIAKANNYNNTLSGINSSFNQGLGAILGGLSEREAKRDIEEIGLWDGKDGLKKYRFRYKHDPSDVLEGVMADEVEALRPWALGARLPNGWRTVNYAAL